MKTATLCVSTPAFESRLTPSKLPKFGILTTGPASLAPSAVEIPKNNKLTAAIMQTKSAPVVYKTLQGKACLLAPALQ